MIKRLILCISLISCISQAGSPPETVRSSVWQLAEQRAKNAVVQVVAQHHHFNWLEPYKSPATSSGAGSGFLISQKGDILTNFHVVEQAAKLEVFVPAKGQQPLEAEIVGVCPEADVAHIRLTQNSLEELQRTCKKVPFLTLGDSDTLFPTEPVLAIGYPLGQRYLKCTVGVLAGKEYLDGKSYMHITAPISPGSSGGPLLNLAGNVVGINSAGIPGQNIGYIIAMYDVKILLEDLKKQSLVTKPHPGIRYNTTTKELAELLGNPLPAGVYIHTVEKGSSADKAGIKPGDMLYEINGCLVDSYGDVTVNLPSALKISLDEFLLRQQSNSSLTCVIYRNGEQKRLVCKDCAIPCCVIRDIYPDYEPDEVDYEVIGGMCVMQLRLNHVHAFEQLPWLQSYRQHTKKHKKLVIVTKVIPGSVVAETGCVFDGVLLDQINDQKVRTLDEFRKALRTSLTSGYLKIKTTYGATTAVSLEKVLKDEERLTKKIQFTSTTGMKDLQQHALRV